MRWLPGTRILTDASCSRLPGDPVLRAGVPGAEPPGAGLMACERAKVRARVVEPDVSRSPRMVRTLERPDEEGSASSPRRPRGGRAARAERRALPGCGPCTTPALGGRNGGL